MGAHDQMKSVPTITRNAHSTPYPCLTGFAGPCRDRLSVVEHPEQGTRQEAGFDLGALSRGELTKMQKAVRKAISTFEDRQKAETHAKVEAFA